MKVSESLLKPHLLLHRRPNYAHHHRQRHHFLLPPKTSTANSSSPSGSPRVPSSDVSLKPYSKAPSPIIFSKHTEKNHDNSLVGGGGGGGGGGGVIVPRWVVVGGISIGVAAVVMLGGGRLGGREGQEALAMGLGGPEGPLLEEFWDNVRRYGLYMLTVSTGAIYTILLPIFELLKNPFTALLLLVVLGGAFFIFSQVLSAMVGISEFSYNYSY